MQSNSKEVTLSEEVIQRHLDFCVKEQTIKAGYTMETKLDSLPEETRLLILAKREAMEKDLRREYHEKTEAEYDDIPDLVYADGTQSSDFASGVAIELSRDILSESEDLMDSLNYFKIRLTSGSATSWILDDEDQCGGRLFFPSVKVNDNEPDLLWEFA